MAESRIPEPRVLVQPPEPGSPQAAPASQRSDMPAGPTRTVPESSADPGLQSRPGPVEAKPGLAQEILAPIKGYATVGSGIPAKPIPAPKIRVVKGSAPPPRAKR